MEGKKKILCLNNRIRFGPSGNSDSFYKEGNKSSIEMPKWLYDMGLNAYEYSLTRGINIKEETARLIGQQASKYDIAVSVHAPYYINLASPEKEKAEKSIQYILDSLEVATWLGANRIVFHPGSCARMSRQKANENIINMLKQLVNQAKDYLQSGLLLCPETMGKINQIGTLDEILYFCTLHENIIPTLDFGHIHARGLGAINSKDDYVKILDKVENAIGYERTRNFHSHFSHIEFTERGEKKHWTLSDTEYGPEFSFLAEVIIERDLTPIIICESRGVMAEDALRLKNIYEEKITLSNNVNI
ncbi:MAG: TIM barrel protein [Caldicoprobacterales bacterium]